MNKETTERCFCVELIGIDNTRIDMGTKIYGLKTCRTVGTTAAPQVVQPVLHTKHQQVARVQWEGCMLKSRQMKYSISQQDQVFFAESMRTRAAQKDSARADGVRGSAYPILKNKTQRMYRGEMGWYLESTGSSRGGGG